MIVVNDDRKHSSSTEHMRYDNNSKPCSSSSASTPATSASSSHNHRFLDKQHVPPPGLYVHFDRSKPPPNHPDYISSNHGNRNVDGVLPPGGATIMDTYQKAKLSQQQQHQPQHTWHGPDTATTMARQRDSYGFGAGRRDNMQTAARTPSTSESGSEHRQWRTSNFHSGSIDRTSSVGYSQNGARQAETPRMDNEGRPTFVISMVRNSKESLFLMSNL